MRKGARVAARSTNRVVWGALSVGSVLLVWEVLNRAGLVSSALMSSPSALAAAGAAEIGRGTLWRDAWATFSVWATGFSAAIVVGVPVGLLAGWYSSVGHIANPWLNVLYSVPSLALVPIFILWFGIGFQFKVFLVFMSAIFFIAINTLAGVRSTEARFIDVAETYGASGFLLFRTIVLPGSVPHIITGIRQGAARAIVGVVVAEFVSANQGIGFMITLAGSTLNTARLMFGLAILAAFGIVVGELLRRVEQHFETWRPEILE